MAVNFNVSGVDPGTTAAGATGGPGTLSYAIAQINAMPASGGPYTITLTGNVTLKGPLSPILNSVTINGGGHTIDAGASTRIFFVGTDNASQTANPGSILSNRQQVTISNVTLANGTAQGGAGGPGAGGGLGAGGAIFVDQSADVTLSKVSFSGDKAVGGNGAAGTAGGGGGLGGDGGGGFIGGGGGLFGAGGSSGIGGGGGIFGNGGGGGFGYGGGGGFSGNGGTGARFANTQAGNGAGGKLSISGLAGGGGNGTSSSTFGGIGGGTGGGGGGGAAEGGASGGGGGFRGSSGVDGGGKSHGGDGGFGGGGGSGGDFGAGDGGFGGGGGGGEAPGAGGFGGGGGGSQYQAGGAGGFGGGGGYGGNPFVDRHGGAGGFGAGGGGAYLAGNGGIGGFGSSVAGQQSGGGGAGMGGAVFVASGGTLQISGDGTIAGTATGGDNGAGEAASAFGAGIFYQGTSGALSTLSIGSGDQTVTASIDDYIGQGGTNPGNGVDQADTGGKVALSKNGAGILKLSATSTYSGGTTIAGGATVDLTATGAAGSGTITLAGSLGKTVVLSVEKAAQPVSGGVFTNTLVDFGRFDQVDLQGFAFSGNAVFTVSNGQLAVTEGGATETFKLGGTFEGTYYARNDGHGGTLVDDVPVCFASGTRIRTARGELAVEALQVGDRVATASGGLRPVVWIGHRTMRPVEHAIPSDLWPVRVCAGAFGIGLPHNDLWLSPGHPVLVGADEAGGGHLVPIMCLINGTTIERMQVDAVTYWHVELARHDILLAEGLPAESYLDWGDRAFFTEGADHALANPDFVVPGLDGRCRPVALDGPVVEAERRRLDMVFAGRLAAACHWPTAEDALAF